MQAEEGEEGWEGERGDRGGAHPWEHPMTKPEPAVGFCLTESLVEPGIWIATEGHDLHHVPPLTQVAEMPFLPK